MDNMKIVISISNNNSSNISIDGNKYKFGKMSSKSLSPASANRLFPDTDTLKRGRLDHLKTSEPRSAFRLAR